MEIVLQLTALHYVRYVVVCCMVCYLDIFICSNKRLGGSNDLMYAKM